MSTKPIPQSVRERAEKKKLAIKQLTEKHSKQKEEMAEHDSSKQLEKEMEKMSLAESEKQIYRERLQKAEEDAQKDMRKRLTTDDFEPLAIIGRGAFGEVRLVRMRDRNSKEVFGEMKRPKVIYPVFSD